MCPFITVFNCTITIYKIVVVLLCLFGHLYGIARWAEEEVNSGGGPIIETGFVEALPTEDAFL